MTSKPHSELVQRIETSLARLLAQDRFEIQYVEDGRAALASLQEQHEALRETARRMSEQVDELSEDRIERNARIKKLQEQLETAQRTLRKVKRKWPGTRPSWLTEAVASTPASEPKENA